MRLIAAFFRLIRLPNLLFIALTQSLFQFCIYLPLYPDAMSQQDIIWFVLLVLASLFIAAAGYIINDYFDINIDEVNKPQKMVVDKIIRRRWAIAWHFMLSVAGILLTALAVPLREKWYLVLVNIACVALLWLYSTRFKKGLLIGNVVISLLTAWTILIVFFSKLSLDNAFAPGSSSQPKFFRFAFLYAGFAFIISLVREAVKDMEDIKGDEKYGCRTMPIVWGINATKVYVAVWLIVLIVMLLIIQVYILQFQWWWPVVYTLLLIILPLGYIFKKLYRASSPEDYRWLSNRIKWVMLSGILSMVFFYFYLYL
ncbi:MAG: geranylgeranylglycerol-phosphate geranylgeranyltransferase [Chitinophagaceae bacterium]|nr:geranylgeranylglycerol-phosphate geranylgeranyltransferase [Chitinophagaceae bacterium]